MDDFIFLHPSKIFIHRAGIVAQQMKLLPAMPASPSASSLAAPCETQLPAHVPGKAAAHGRSPWVPATIMEIQPELQAPSQPGPALTTVTFGERTGG